MELFVFEGWGEIVQLGRPQPGFRLAKSRLFGSDRNWRDIGSFHPRSPKARDRGHPQLNNLLLKIVTTRPPAGCCRS